MTSHSNATVPWRVKSKAGVWERWRASLVVWPVEAPALSKVQPYITTAMVCQSRIGAIRLDL